MEEHINPYIDNIRSLEYYLDGKPGLYDIINYYWVALFNNQHHKMNYIQLKSLFSNECMLRRSHISAKIIKKAKI